MPGSRWDDSTVQSMYDKTLLSAETREIAKHLPNIGTICDAGCGEGEGTEEYASLALDIEAFDSSETRLKMARERLKDFPNVSLYKHDVRAPFKVNGRFDAVVCQRVLINLESWDEQKRAIENLARATNGRLILSEGSMEGVEALNEFRSLYGLKPIPVPEHNIFLHDSDLVQHVQKQGLKLVDSGGLGAFYLLTRGVQPVLKWDFHWGSRFNFVSASDEVRRMLPEAERFARVKVWVFDR